MGTEIVSGIFLVIVAIIEAVAAKERKKVKAFNDKAEQRAEQRAEESRLSMQMMSATMKLSIVTANALTGGHNNGNVEEAKALAQKADEEYQAFLKKVVSKEISY